MSPAFNPPVRFTRLVLKVNAFLLVALLLGVAFIGLVAYKQGWFIHHTVVHFLTPNATGVNPGMPVKLYGFTVGSVKDIDIAHRGVDVRLSIMSAHLVRLPKGTLAKLSREAGVVGASVIDLIPPEGGGAPLEQGDRIEFEGARSLTQIIDDIRRQAVPAFNELKAVLADMARSKDDVTASLAELRKGLEGLPETHRALRSAVSQATATLKAAERASDSADRAATNIERAVPAISSRLVTSLDSLDAATGQIRKTGEEAQDTLRRARPILERGETAAREAGDVMTAAKRTWPLSDSFKETGEKMLPIDSFEASSVAR